jgi:phosphatidylserine/phosphatidylglycerophosphate/cardiolipin synthase-like enzyme
VCFVFKKRRCHDDGFNIRMLLIAARLKAIIPMTLCAVFLGLVRDGLSGAAQANPQVEIVARRFVFDAITHARTITLAAFSMRANSTIVRRLEAAAGRGARVSVVLSRGFGIYSRGNAETARHLMAHGVRVHLVTQARPGTHIKAAILDGQLYLSDRNWSSRVGDEIVVHDVIPGDRTLIERALLGEARSNDHLWTRKADALVAEAQMLHTVRSRRVRLSSESFSAGTPVYEELLRRQAAGTTVLLLIASSEFRHSHSEQVAITRLTVAGVEVRLSVSNEKMAIDGDHVWIGSANATRGLPNQIEFGMIIGDSAIARRLMNQFDREWKVASEISAAL